jgi:hypothetical protein
MLGHYPVFGTIVATAANALGSAVSDVSTTEALLLFSTVRNASEAVVK